MRPRRGRRTAALASVLLLLLVAGLPILVLYSLRSPVEPFGAADYVFAVLLLAFPVVGWVIVVRQPQNPLGWILLAFPFFLGLGVISEERALRAVHEGSDSNVALMLIAGSWFQFLGYWLLIGPAILLFPDGKNPGNRFRWALWGLAALLLIWGIALAIGTEEVCIARFDELGTPCLQSVDNPIGLMAAFSLDEAIDALVMGVFMLTLVTSVTSLILRYLRSTGDVRQQIKWVAWVAAVGLLTIMGLIIGQEVLGVVESEWADALAFSPIVVGLPIAIGFSILKYRLYDIDRIISRTAAYAVIVAMLAAVYVASVTLMQRLLPIQGQFGIVVSTLIAAALFNPLRWRVQNAVDRRFNRSRYDARRVLDEFSSQLREDVDLEQMQVALLRAAQNTMEPEHLSLWIRERER